MTTPAVSIRSLSKTFAGVRVLHDACLDVLPGEIHGLVGRNGSGKSTLIKILSGYHAPDPGGHVEVGGIPVSLPIRAGESHRLGLSFVHQDLGLMPGMTVLENLRIGRFQTRPGWRISWRSERARVREGLERFDVPVAPDALVSYLPMVDRLLVAIVRAFCDLEESEGGVLVLDEPTAYLPFDGVDRLFAAVRAAAGDGAGILFVSHRLEEITGLTDRVSVLRDGHLVGTVDTAGVTWDGLVEMILGRPANDAASSHPLADGAIALSVRDLRGRQVRGTSFDLRAGEVLGLTGLVGMGHEEVPYLLFGAAPAVGGEMVIAGRTIRAGELSPARAMQHGVALVPADRQGASGAGGLSVSENVSVTSLGRFFDRGWLRHRRETAHVRELLHDYEVHPAAPGRRLETLSGGNQQKALLAKWFQRRPRFVLLHEPTQGVDVGAREEIFAQIRAMAREGSSVLLCTSDYDDLERVCDRVLVFRYGRVVTEIVGEALGHDQIVQHCYASERPAA